MKDSCIRTLARLATLGLLLVVPWLVACSSGLSAPTAPAAMPTSSSAVDGWVGIVHPLCAQAEFDDYFQRTDNGEEYGIAGATADVEARIADVRCQPRTTIKVWGRLEFRAMDSHGRRIVAERVVVISAYPPPVNETGPGEEAVDGWQGHVYPFCRDRGADDLFERDDGLRFGIAAETSALREAVERAGCEGYPVRVWGTLYKGVADYRGTQIVVERIEKGS